MALFRRTTDTPPADVPLTDAQLADRDAILDASRRQAAALMQASVEDLDVLLDPGFTALHIDGTVQRKPEWLAAVRSGWMTYHGFQEQSIDVTLHGDTATVVGRARVDATIYGGRATWPLQTTTQYSHGSDGRWRALKAEVRVY